VLSPFRGGGIAYLSDPDSYVGWSSVCTPDRATQARQVEGSRSDKVAAHSLCFPIFLPFTFLLFSSIISPFLMLYSSVYNLFALIGRKAPFTHSFLDTTQGRS